MNTSSDWVDEIEDELEDPLIQPKRAQQILKVSHKAIYDILNRNPEIKIQVNKRSVRVITKKFLDFLRNGGFKESDQNIEE